MGKALAFLGALGSAILLAGCQTPLPPGTERGPDGTIAYDVLIEASSPGVRIEVNGDMVGETPMHLKIFGDRDGTFHDFGSYEFVIRAFPVATNQFVQTRSFQTGHLLTPEDRIPQRIYFDMNQPAPVYVPVPVYSPPPVYYEPPSIYFGPRYYWGPRYYHGPRYYGPGFRSHITPHHFPSPHRGHR
jgi:hypothetical protein